MKNKKTNIDIIADSVTEMALSCIEKEKKMPWEMPWNQNLGVFAHNHSTGYIYRGVNCYLTFISQLEEYKHNAWITFDQLANKMGFKKVRSGKFFWYADKNDEKVKYNDLKALMLKDVDAKRMPVENWTPNIYLREGWKKVTFKQKARMIEEGTHTNEDFVVRFPQQPRIHLVYNIEQTKLPLPKPKKTKKLKKTEVEKTLHNLIKEMKNSPALKIDGRNACYSPSKHTIHMPTMKQFKDKSGYNGTSESHYFHTGCHELVHSSGHKNCLSREGITDLGIWGDHRYAKEELVAESGAEMLARYFNFDTSSATKNTEAYLQGWVSRLKNDSKIMASALRDSSKAVHYILEGK